MKKEMVKTIVLSLSTAVVLGMTGCGSSSNENTVPNATVNSGIAIDGILSGSTVCVDVNLNGECDTNEDQVKTDITTGAYTLTTSQVGPLLVVGGNDLGTGLPFTGSLKAPQGATVITPLTSLVQAMIENGFSKDDAESSVKVALGISADVPLIKFNPLTELTGTNAVKAKLILEKQAQIQTMIHAAATAISSADAGTSIENTMDDVFKEFSKKFDNATSEVTIDSNSLETTINKIAETVFSSDVSMQNRVKEVSKNAALQAIELAESIVKNIQESAEQDIEDNFNEGMKSVNTTLEDGLKAALNPYVGKVTTAGSKLPYTVLDATIDDGAKPGSKMEIRNGGYGSAAAADPKNSNRFYALTDRGPNATYTGVDGKGKMFPTPEYTPRIGHFEIAEDGSVSLVKEILLKDTSNHNITGLPNSAELGGTGEIPYDKNGNTLKNSDGTFKTDDFGLDSEGLAVLKDGTFWISDEYGPHMVHFDATGKEIGRINAFADDNRTQYNLPAEFQNRRANRGMEGLTITPDQKTLVGIMQSTMSHPSSAVNSLNITRIVTVNLETNTTGQYLYKQEKAANSNSEIVALTNDSFLVIERDGTFAKDTATGQKYVYKISLSSGTNLENVETNTTLVQDANLGLTINGKTLEEAVLDANKTWDTLSSNGIVPVSKTLVVDMVKENGYSHDKMEGLIVFNETKLGILNDDDFATWATGGVLEQKYLDTNKTKVDGNMLYVVDVDLN